MFSAPCYRCEKRLMTENYRSLVEYGWSIFDASVKPALLLCDECTHKEINNRRDLLFWQTNHDGDMPKSTTTTTAPPYPTWVSSTSTPAGKESEPEIIETIVVFDDGTRDLLYLTKFSLDVLIKQLEDRYEDNYEKWTRLTHYVGTTRHVFVAMIDDIHHLA